MCLTSFFSIHCAILESMTDGKNHVFLETVTHKDVGVIAPAILQERITTMPGFTTHYIMGMKAYNDMPSNTLKHIISKYRWLYQLGLQGPDMFFYYIPALRHRDYRNVASYMHEHHVQEFFECYLKESAKIPFRQQREQAIAYFCGYLCHYIGDSICHPYVYGRIQYDIDNPSMAHHGKHAELENDIDALLLRRYKKKKPSEFNQAATICLNGLETQFISRHLAKCINDAYYPITYRNNFQISPRMVQRSILALRFGCRTLSDPSGRKKTGLQFMESLLRRHHVASRKLVTDQVSDTRWSLNLDHEIWCNPWKKQMASTQSFPDLFYQCLTKCRTVYYLFNQLITSGAAPDELDLAPLLHELGSYSFHSGLPVD